MLTRIRLRRTDSTLAGAQDSNDKLRKGEPLYSFSDKRLVIGDGTTRAESLPARIYAFEKVSRKYIQNKDYRGLVFAGPAGGTTQGNAAFPTFRELSIYDLPNKIPASKLDTIPASKISGIPTYTAGLGISINNSYVISNAGVRSIETGNSNGQIKVNTGGTTTNITIRGLDTAAYKSENFFVKSPNTNGKAGGLKFSSDSDAAPPNTVYDGSNTGNMLLSYNSIGAASQTNIDYPAARALNADSAAIATQASSLVNEVSVRVKLNKLSEMKYNGSQSGTFEIGVVGTLPVSRGGTGQNQWANLNGIIKAPDTSQGALTAIKSQPGALYSTSTNGVPKFDTLPVAQGGTGKTSWTAGQLIYAKTSTELDQVINPGTNNILVTNSNSKPEWSSTIPSNLITSSLDTVKVYETLTKDTGFNSIDMLDPNQNPDYTYLELASTPWYNVESIPSTISWSPSNVKLSVFADYVQLSNTKIRLSQRTSIVSITSSLPTTPPNQGSIFPSTPFQLSSPVYYVAGEKGTSSKYDVDFSQQSEIILCNLSSSTKFYGQIVIDSDHSFKVRYRYVISESTTAGQFSTTQRQIKQSSLSNTWYNKSYWSQITTSSQMSTGILNNSVTLYRGTLYDQLKGSKYAYYEGTGYNWLRIDLKSLFGYVPRSVSIYGNVAVSSAGSTYTQFSPEALITIDLVNLFTGSAGTPNPLSPPNPEPPVVPTNGTLFAPSGEAGHGGFIWFSTDCEQVMFELPTSDSTTQSVDTLNKLGCKYLCVANN